jgi:hypothetical protein
MQIKQHGNHFKLLWENTYAQIGCYHEARHVVEFSTRGSPEQPFHSDDVAHSLNLNDDRL